jgi:hypothetical protein
MIKSLQVVFAVLIPGVLLVCPVRADEKDKSPEDVFKDFAAAVKRGDVRAGMAHMTRDSQSAIAGSTCFAAVLSKPSRILNNTPFSPKEKELINAIDDVLNRHGLSEGARSKAMDQYKKEATADEDECRLFVVVGEVVKEKAAFVAEMIKVLEPADDGKELGVTGIGEAKVKEVQIDGKRARGQVSFPGADGKEQSASIYFKAESGVWKIDFIETSRNWPQPPPPPPAQVQRPPTQAQLSVVVCETQRRVVRCWCPCLRRW